MLEFDAVSQKGKKGKTHAACGEKGRREKTLRRRKYNVGELLNKKLNHRGEGLGTDVKKTFQKVVL